MVTERLRGKGLGGAVQVSLVTPGDSILAGSPQGQRSAALEVLSGLRVEILTGANRPPNKLRSSVCPHKRDPRCGISAATAHAVRIQSFRP